VHKETVVACARIVEGSQVQQHLETFATTTSGLMALSDWLSGHGCTHVVMEATGVYWKPVWHVLEGEFDLVLANAAHVKNVPGRKTDVNDAMWLADLLAHGLVRSSFVPPEAIQELRTLTRTRKQLVREKAQHVQRIHKVLEDANVKVTSVLTDILGKSGRAMLEALVAGETNAEKLADLAHGRLRPKRAELVEALRGRVRQHHRFLLRLHLDQIGALDRSIAAVEQEVGSQLEPFRAAVEHLKTMPGVSDTVAQVIVAEIGVDMSRFPTAGHLVSWAGLCPRNDESAGKRRSTRVRKGAPWLKTILVQAAWSAVRVKQCYLRSQFHRIKARRGPKKAILAVAASMLNAIYYMLRDGVDYRDLGANYFDRADKEKATLRLVRRLRDLGYDVDLRAAA
jgi:transposase